MSHAVSGADTRKAADGPRTRGQNDAAPAPARRRRASSRGRAAQSLATRRRLGEGPCGRSSGRVEARPKRERRPGPPPRRRGHRGRRGACAPRRWRPRDRCVTRVRVSVCTQVSTANRGPLSPRSRVPRRTTSVPAYRVPLRTCVPAAYLRTCVPAYEVPRYRTG